MIPAGSRWLRVTLKLTATSITRSEPRACTAVLRARPARRGRRTSVFIKHAKKPKRRTSGPANAASRTGPRWLGIGLDLLLDIRGTTFQQRVWQALREIPVGQTASYTDIAKRIGSPKAVRAVAQACATNALAVVIPCNRVVRNDGALSGYRWGVERKRALLRREAEGEAHV